MQPSVPITYLAGSSSNSAVERTCSIEKGHYVFMPILTTMRILQEPDEERCQVAAEAESRLNDRTPAMDVKVDGVPVLDMATRRVFQHRCAVLTPEQRMVFDGYWLTLKPLTPGKHTIEFVAAYDDDEHPLGHMRQVVRYNLTVR